MPGAVDDANTVSLTNFPNADTSSNASFRERKRREIIMGVKMCVRVCFHILSSLPK